MFDHILQFWRKNSRHLNYYLFEPCLTFLKKIIQKCKLLFVGHLFTFVVCLVQNPVKKQTRNVDHSTSGPIYFSISSQRVMVTPVQHPRQQREHIKQAWWKEKRPVCWATFATNKRAQPLLSNIKHVGKTIWGKICVFFHICTYTDVYIYIYICRPL